MTQPIRLQLSRAKGFDLQSLSRATNGLPAVNVARPTKWGNIYVVVDNPKAEGLWEDGRVGVRSPNIAVWLYRSQHMGHESMLLPEFLVMRRALPEIRGKNLACWCSPIAPCHADVLLDLANRPVCEALP